MPAPAPRGANPFDSAGVQPDENGVRRYADLHDSIVAIGAAVDPQAVLAYAREHLADFKVPQFVAVRNDPLPRNPNGKVLKARLRDTDFGTPLF